jgi:glycosyltransferase involved in cell wall biosynthesis
MSAVGVVVPVRNEQDPIGACLHSVRAAMARLPSEIATAVTVVLDHCDDATPDLVAALVQDWPEAAAVRIAALGGRAPRSAPNPCTSWPARASAPSGISVSG